MSKDKVEQPKYSCEMYSPMYLALCAVGGIAACGTTHTLVTPIDLVKCRIQTNPAKYRSIFHGFKVSLQEGGVRNIVRGWAPTFVGYSFQGAFKFAGYEFFKHTYSTLVGEESAYLYRPLLYLAASASAEFVADIALCPFEATKVRVQTTPGYTSQMSVAMPRMKSTEGFGVFYRGIAPLWGRQIPYTMMKFTSFEVTLEYLYKHLVPKKRSDCSKTEQLLVTFTAGYIAGVACAVVSHPADTIVSKLNKDPTDSIRGIIAEVGMWGIWRGLCARIIMIGALTGMQWFIYDAFKVYTNMPRPPPPEMPESLRLKYELEEKMKAMKK